MPRKARIVLPGVGFPIVALVRSATVASIEAHSDETACQEPNKSVIC